ncbi:FAD:protein FMN transferase [Rheinheimera baltica]|uniref:FAD:protein FMN transferase n=1 Tax=Rheinheimera baltica TaxID=67576 RepID=UPI000408A738|nr:FAD:protein FMN transferase [Rheinheimera baltica]MDP5141151.1 FAD:protein FMN transferase [Rheinheimera baltica]MDP5189146.1 FAD:protein FMN transferase [Rheinheimera baltica]
MTDVAVSRGKNCTLGQFSAMASPCEILLETADMTLCRELTLLAAAEAERIEQKYSRYRTDSVLSQLNQGAGQWQQLDDETAQLLTFANTCYQLSDGLFDISSGILRRAWQFDGSDRLASQAQLAALLPHIGWHQVQLKPKQILLPAGMELDLGGIAKEYAVDKVLQLLRAQFTPSSLPSIVVNFGGDMHCSRPRHDGSLWHIGIENPGLVDHAISAVGLTTGALATSGDSRRFLLKDGVRYSHILNPKTGWPVTDAPRSVTVAAPNCLLAGMLATTALLQGASAEAFLQAQGLKYWLVA